MPNLYDYREALSQTNNVGKLYFYVFRPYIFTFSN